MAGLVGERPRPGVPRPYQFPRFTRVRMENGLQIIGVNVPDRPLGSALLILEAGASNEAEEFGGVAALAAQALTEGTEGYEGADFVDAVERLGADVSASADWDSFRVDLGVPMGRMEVALELLAEAVRRPVFPDREVERLKQERLGFIMQEYVNAATRAHKALMRAIYSPDSPYSRPDAGSFKTVASLDREGVDGFYRRFATPGSATLIVAGDIEGFPLENVAEKLFSDWKLAEPQREAPKVEEAITETSVTLVNRPGSVQSQINIGHVGLPRETPDYFAVSVTSMALGGLFNSRLNMRLREERGFTYGAHSRFEFRRQAGPFYADSAVQTSATVDAVADTIEVLRRIRDEGLTKQELEDAQNYLIGVFPLRFETPAAIAQALAQLVTFGLPDDYFDNYRANIEAVSLEESSKAAANHLRPDRLAIVVVGDADSVGDSIRSAGFGPVAVIEDPPPGQPPE